MIGRTYEWESQELSVLTVNYRSLDFLMAQIKALRVLTFNNYRLYIMDNGSPARHLRKIRDFIDPRLRQEYLICRQQ